MASTVHGEHCRCTVNTFGVNWILSGDTKIHRKSICILVYIERVSALLKYHLVGGWTKISDTVDKGCPRGQPLSPSQQIPHVLRQPGICPDAALEEASGVHLFAKSCGRAQPSCEWTRELPVILLDKLSFAHSNMGLCPACKW